MLKQNSHSMHALKQKLTALVLLMNGNNVILPAMTPPCLNIFFLKVIISSDPIKAKINITEVQINIHPTMHISIQFLNLLQPVGGQSHITHYHHRGEQRPGL